MEIEDVTCNTVSSLPAWRTYCTCRHSHTLKEPPAKDGVWNGLSRLAHSYLCTAFGSKDFHWSTTLCMPESVVMNRQIDWQAQQLSHLVCSLAGQRCSEAWGTLWTWTGQSITALIAKGKRNGERKRTTFHPPRSGTICVLPDKDWHCLEGNLGETAERRGGARMGLSECYEAILCWNWNWTLIRSQYTA